MIGVQLICVGKLKEKFYLQACQEYAKRLTTLCKLTVTELPERRLPDSPSPARIALALEKEGDDILRQVPKGAKLTALCVEGSLLSSENLSGQMDRWASQGASQLVFVIGGSFGLHDKVKEAAALRLSLSPMTFPHHLARVLLLEQIYRGFQISKGTRYHK